MMSQFEQRDVGERKPIKVRLALFFMVCKSCSDPFFISEYASSTFGRKNIFDVGTIYYKYERSLFVGKFSLEALQ